MALLNAGTAATNTLRAIKWVQNMNVADLAALNAFSAYDYISTIKKPTPTLQQGMLWDSERGSLKLFPGDYVLVDPASGLMFPISATAATAGSWIIV